MSKADWIWMPHAGHFIGGDKCQFHLATWVKGVVVSTVGEYWTDYDVRRCFAKSRMMFSDEKKIDMSLKGDDFDYEYRKVFGYETLGLNRLYETMVFKAKKQEVPEYQCCPYVMIRGDDLDFEGYNTAADAYRGHLEMCEKWESMSEEEKGKIIKDCSYGDEE